MLFFFKDCIEIEGERFISRGKKLLVKNVSVEDRGNYECDASLTHANKQYTVFNSISVTVSKYALIFTLTALGFARDQWFWAEEFPHPDFPED